MAPGTRSPALGSILGALLLSACSSGGGDGAATVDGAARNLLIITLDTVRQDHLSAYGGGAEVPHLERLAREGARFDSAFTVTPLTLPAHVSLFTGLYPAAHGVHNNTTFRLKSEARTLAETLRENGFRTGAFVAAQVLDSRYGLAQGFERYDDLLPPEETVESLFVERSAGEVVDLALAWLEEEDERRWFLWVHLFDPHWEYRPPEPFLSRYPDSPYDGEIAYTDQEMGRLIDLLRERGDLDETVVVVTSDHGESLDEHGESTHGLFLYEATVEIPLVLRYPARLKAGLQVGDLVRIIDIFPTVTDLLGIPEDLSGIQGESLIPVMEGRPGPERVALLETRLPRLSYGWSELTAIRDAEWKYIVAPRPELYHVALDRTEANNEVEGRPDLASEYRARLETLITEAAASSSLADAQTVDPATRRALESLGYVSLGSSAPAEGQLPDPKDRVAEMEEIQRAVGLVAGKRYAEAIPVLQELIARNPQSGFLHGHLGEALRKTDRIDEAIVVLRRGVELEPRDHGMWNDLGNAYLDLGRDEEAELAFRQVLAINPEIATGYHNLGQMEHRRGNLDGAIALYEQALALDPNLLLSLTNLGVLYQGKERYTEALALYLRIAQLDPSNERAFYSAAYLLQAGGRYDDSLAVLDRAQQAHPASALVPFYKAQIHLRKGDRAAAERELEAALQLDPGNQDVRGALDRLRQESQAGG